MKLRAAVSWRCAAKTFIFVRRRLGSRGPLRRRLVNAVPSTTEVNKLTSAWGRGVPVGRGDGAGSRVWRGVGVGDGMWECMGGGLGVGVDVGARVGSRVGTGDDCAEGTEVGVGSGVWGGCGVGKLVGLKAGGRVGAGVGLGLSSSTGACVGRRRVSRGWLRALRGRN